MKHILQDFSSLVQKEKSLFYCLPTCELFLLGLMEPEVFI